MRIANTYPVHPKIQYAKNVLRDKGLPPYKLAESWGIPKYTLYKIFGGQRKIASIEMAERFAKTFGGKPEDWLGIGPEHELDTGPHSIYNKNKKEQT